MSNFLFLKNEWPQLYAKAKKAEQRIYDEPVSSANYARLILEECIYKLYELEYIPLPYNTELRNLMTHESIKSIVPYNHLNGIHIVRKTGNNASHYGKRVTGKDALISIKYLYGFLKWFAYNYNKEEPELPCAFNEELVPKLEIQQRALREIQKEREKEQKQFETIVEKLLAEKAEILEKAKESELSLQQYLQKEAAAKNQIKEQRRQRLAVIPSEYNEAQTRSHLIDANLKEAGWEMLQPGRELEFPLKGMPVTNDNPAGNGKADYVLWDDNALPLAVIEAKRTTIDAEKGRHQAFLYANCLEEMYGQRPLIFYTNGYEIKIWDDAFYSTPRSIYGFYTKDELQWSIQQRKNRLDPRNAKVDAAIAGRPYQMLAIQRIAETLVVDSGKTFRGNKRNALLVMATGSGKTRTAAAIVDVLIKQNWAKRILFLADRNALVTQAKNRFAEFLPNLTSIDLTQEKENDSTRLVFSTYPTMMNRIDNVRNSSERFYGVGHFDLIIIDEAHRSVYNRYQAIFEYFDASIIGLTATPKNSIDHNTYELFDCGTNDPTYAYELDEAVPTYLKAFRKIDVSTKFVREGIRYSELSEEEKSKYEETFQDKATGLFPEEISSNAMNKWLFNTDTINKVLDQLMERGLKIEGGDKLGRTIIFAVNQTHAKFIVDCFTKRYPQYQAGFIAMVHNKVSHAQSLIESFCDEHNENLPQIAVSVDMMDTGIDAPRILNLVFFKVVRSYAKFWQMIGRGTRLCPNVYGPNKPKEYFLIFDVCQNFEFFEENAEGLESSDVKPITQQLFESRLQLSRLLAETGNPDNIALAHELLDMLHRSIAGLNKDNFQVKMRLRYVDEFEKRERWNNLSSDDIHNIEKNLSGLPNPEPVNELTRRFDLLMLKLQLAELLNLTQSERLQNNLINIAQQLSKKYTIPEVAQSRLLIEEMKNPDFYRELSQRRLDEIRKEIRDLVKYIESEKQKHLYINLEDEINPGNIQDGGTGYGQNWLYRERVERFIRENKHNLTISKLNTNEPITIDELHYLEQLIFDGEERGTKKDFINNYGEKPLGVFIRSIVGLDQEAAMAAFADFIQSGNLSADQMTFINNLINHLTQNGVIDKKMLFEPPFTRTSDQGLLGVFDDATAVKIINIIDQVNGNAVG